MLTLVAIALAQPAGELADISADANGDIHIKFAMGRKVVPPRQKDQTGVSKPSIGSRKVAYCEVRTYREPNPEYSLFDIATKRQLQDWSGELTDKAPAWAHFLSRE